MPSLALPEVHTSGNATLHSTQPSSKLIQSRSHAIDVIPDNHSIDEENGTQLLLKRFNNKNLQKGGKHGEEFLCIFAFLSEGAYIAQEDLRYTCMVSVIVIFSSNDSD